MMLSPTHESPVINRRLRISIQLASRPLQLATFALLALPAYTATAQSLEELMHLSIDELANIPITSVLKTSEPLSAAPAAIYVITHDDIIRSGATSIPEMLRLAPNLQVAQLSTHDYAITARGFSGNAADQSYSDKLLVLIDGRSVYTPLFSGVYWDMQDVMPRDIDRIEVISGPGATLWGANAVNGVINIITRQSNLTQGSLVEIGGGNLERNASARYGGRLTDDSTYRVYAKGFRNSAMETDAGTDANDDWSKSQGGFRIDWNRAADALTVQGDIYRGTEGQLGAPNLAIAGGNLLTRWQHRLDGGSTLQIQAYYDKTQRYSGNDGSGFVLDTYDLEIQHSFALGDRNNIIWGGGDRISRYRIDNTDTFLFEPANNTLALSNVFAQDNITLAESVQLVLGMKFENDPYSGLTHLPNARLSWKVSDTALLWSAVARAVRSPTPFDNDVIEKQGAQVILAGSGNFKPEKLTAYEIGYRGQPSARLSLSISTFYNVYDDLRNIEITPTSSTFLPLQWSNMMEGETYGAEIWGNYQATDSWRLSAGFNLLHENLRLKKGSFGELLGVGTEQAGNDPRHQFSLRSVLNISHNITLDAAWRYVGALPNPAVRSYNELSARIGWDISASWSVALAGFNLLRPQHQEYTVPPSDAVQRSLMVDTSWRF